MKIMYVYASEPPKRALQSVLTHAPGAIHIDTSSSITAYQEAIASHWTGEEDLLIIEGDKEINATVVPTMTNCNELWCCYTYKNYPPPYQKKEIYGLGCTKYSTTVQQKVSTDVICGPDPAWQTVCNVCGGKGCWQYLDTRIAINILSQCITFAPHEHGEINHLHDYPDDWFDKRGLPRELDK